MQWLFQACRGSYYRKTIKQHIEQEPRDIDSSFYSRYVMYLGTSPQRKVAKGTRIVVRETTLTFS